MTEYGPSPLYEAMKTFLAYEKAVSRPVCYSCGFENRILLNVGPSEWTAQFHICENCARNPKTVERLLREIASLYLAQIARFAGKSVADYTMEQLRLPNLKV